MILFLIGVCHVKDTGVIMCMYMGGSGIHCILLEMKISGNSWENKDEVKKLRKG